MTKEEAWQYMSGWVMAGWSEFLAGQQEYEKENVKYKEAREALMGKDYKEDK